MKFLENDTTRNSNLTWLKAVEVVSVERTSETTGRIVYRFPVQREYLNPGMTLHGGMSAGMFDTATTWVLDVIRKPGFWMSFGTSRSLNVTFIRPAVEGEMLSMDCEVSFRPARWPKYFPDDVQIVHAGKRLCLLHDNAACEGLGQALTR